MALLLELMENNVVDFLLSYFRTPKTTFCNYMLWRYLQTNLEISCLVCGGSCNVISNLFSGFSPNIWWSLFSENIVEHLEFLCRFLYIPNS